VSGSGARLSTPARVAYHECSFIPIFEPPMYLPAHFEENRPEALHALIAAHPLGAFVVSGPNGLDANHVPFEFDASAGAHGTLRAHVARANPVWQEVQAQQDVLVIFQGPTGYISPNWYPSKHEAHRQVPTYNYLVVHAHGRITVRDDEAFVRGFVARLTRRMEAGEPAPWKMGDAPRDYIDQMLAAIVGIEIEVTRLVGKAKLSQNKTDADRRGAADGLRRRGNDAADALADASLTAPPLPK
jgi:transcriptional regulator